MELDKFLDILFQDQEFKKVAKEIVDFTNNARETFATIETAEKQADMTLGSSIQELSRDENRPTLPSADKIDYFLKIVQQHAIRGYKTETEKNKIKREISDAVVARLLAYKYILNNISWVKNLILGISEDEVIRAILEKYWIQFHLLGFNDKLNYRNQPRPKVERANLLLGEALEKLLALKNDIMLIMDSAFADDLSRTAHLLKNKIQEIFSETKMEAEGSAALALGHFIVSHLKRIKDDIHKEVQRISNGGGQK